MFEDDFSARSEIISKVKDLFGKSWGNTSPDQNLQQFIKHFRNFDVIVECDWATHVKFAQPTGRGLAEHLSTFDLNSLRVSLDCREVPTGGLAKSLYMEAQRQDGKDKWQEHHPSGVAKALQPFGLLRGIPHVVVHKVPAAYAEELVRAMQLKETNHLARMLQRILDCKLSSTLQQQLQDAVEMDRGNHFDRPRRQFLKPYKSIHDDDPPADGTYNRSHLDLRLCWFSIRVM